MVLTFLNDPRLLVPEPHYERVSHQINSQLAAVSAQLAFRIWYFASQGLDRNYEQKPSFFGVEIRS